MLFFFSIVTECPMSLGFTRRLNVYCEPCEDLRVYESLVKYVPSTI